MKRTAPVLCLVLVAACGGAAARSTVTNRKDAPTGDRCPTADRVLIAAYTSGTAGSWNREDSPRWHLPLVIKADGHQVAAPALPATVTMFRSTKRGAEPPCVATVGAPYSVVGGDGFTYEEQGVELTGCPAPANDDGNFLAWVSLDEAPGCTLVPAVEDGYRYWDGERWDRKPAGSTAMPAPLAPFVPKTPAGATPESLLWQTRVARVGDRPLAWELATGQVTSPVGTESCNIEGNETIQHFAVVGTRLVPAVELGHPSAWAHLDSVLAVDGSPRVVLLLAVGSYTAIGIAPDGKPTEPRTVEYYIPHDEDNLGLSLVPYCGP